MNNLPREMQDLFQKFGRCKSVRHEVNVSSSRFGRSVKAVLGACVIVRTRKGEFVLVRNRYAFGPGVGPDRWSLPCGEKEENESLEETGVRETLEETGVHVHITGLYRVFHFIQKAPSGETRTASYCAVFMGEVVSGALSSKSPEILEVKTFKQLPKNFAGELRKYYGDLSNL